MQTIISLARRHTKIVFLCSVQMCEIVKSLYYSPHEIISKVTGSLIQNLEHSRTREHHHLIRGFP